MLHMFFFFHLRAHLPFYILNCYVPLITLLRLLPRCSAIFLEGEIRFISSPSGTPLQKKEFLSPPNNTDLLSTGSRLPEEDELCREFPPFPVICSSSCRLISKFCLVSAFVWPRRVGAGAVVYYAGLLASRSVMATVFYNRTPST